MTNTREENAADMAREAEGNLHIPAKEWLAELFECEYCAECRGDACHHTAVPFLGNWFARCDHPPAEDNDATPHPVIVEYRRAAGNPIEEGG